MFTQAILFALIAMTFPNVARAQSDVKQAADPARDSIVRLVAQIQRADYEGDRAALKRIHAELSPPSGNETLASRVLYWDGFALWRSAINGFNESPAPKELEDELNGAIADFDASLAKDPTFVESKIGKVSCLGYVMYLNRKDQARVQELLQQDRPLLKEVQAQAPDNPRLIWVQGPFLWSSPPERGGGQDKAFDNYNKGLESVHKQQPGASDPLEPSWGEPELLMSLAWSNLNRSAPDVAAADQYAHQALQLVPYWHYVRDILLPQIQAAKAKAHAS